MAEPQTIIEGQRTIARQPAAVPAERWRGTLDAEGFREQEWLGPTIEQVVDRMDFDLGTIPDDAYVVTE